MQEFIIEIFQNLGIPAGCLIAMGYYIIKMTDIHREEINSLKEVIDKNTQILTRLYERFKVEKGDENE